MAAVSSSDMRAEIDEIRGDVQEYKPGSASRPPDRITLPAMLAIGLFGRTGCGKTSLINSLKFAVSGRLRRAKWLQVAAQEKAGGHTMYRKLADLTESISVVDNRGLDNPNTEEAVKELRAQLNGERGYTEKVEWQEMETGEEEEYEGIELDESKGHKIGCAVFVFSADHDIDTNTAGLAEVIDFLHINQGRYPLAVITHVDVSEKTTVENLKTVLRVCGVSDIFEVANLTQEKQILEEAYQLNMLNLLDRCMTDGDDTLIFHHFQEKDRERKRQLEQMLQEKKKQEADERRAREERVRREEEEERERVRRERREDEQMLLKLEQQRGLEHERHQQELERFRQEAAARESERQERERERDLKHQEAMKQMENNKELELTRIMQANQKKGSGCSVM